MNVKEYNGWTNYETWAAKLWMDNDQGSYLHWKEAAQDAWDNATADKICTREERARFNLADALKQQHEDDAPDLGSSVWADLLNAALSEINWDEIARAMIEDVDKASDKDETDEDDE